MKSTKAIPFLFGLILLAVPASDSRSQHSRGGVKLVINVGGFKNSTGKLVVTVNNGPGTYFSADPKQKPFLSASAEIKRGFASVTFDGVPSGKYAIGFFHDEDGDGKIKRDKNGKFLEDFGFSNNPRGRNAQPNFEKDKISLGSGYLKKTYRLIPCCR